MIRLTIRLGCVISPQGKIALPLILLAAFCFRDQAINAVHLVRPSWLVCEALSFPVGWLSKSLVEAVVQSFLQQHQTAGAFAVHIAATAGSALNIYLWAALFVFLSCKLRGKSKTTITEDEFQELLDAHRKKDGLQK